MELSKRQKAIYWNKRSTKQMINAWDNLEEAAHKQEYIEMFVQDHIKPVYLNLPQAGRDYCLQLIRDELGI